MAHLGTEVRKLVRRALEDEGVTDLQYSVTGSSHQRFDFTVGSARGHIVFACSPGGSGALKCYAAKARRAVRDLRKA